MKSESFKVAGVTNYEKEIRSLLVPNPDFQLSAAQIREKYSLNKRIPELIPGKTEAALVPEPDNKYDSNAIKVLINGILVGYIKSGSCSHVKKLLKESDVRIVVAEMGLGRYKQVYEDAVDTERYNYPFIKLSVRYGGPDEEPAADQKIVSEDLPGNEPAPEKEPVQQSKAQKDRAAAVKKSKQRLTIFAIFVWIILSALCRVIDPAIVIGVIMLILVTEIFKRFK